MPRDQSSKRGWCFTFNNYEDGDVERIREVCRTHCVYGVFGRERGAERDTPHLQGYLYFSTQRSFKGVRKLVDCDRVHLEAARGSPSQNRDYCTKEGDYEEFGSLPRKGARTDLVQIQAMLDTGVAESEVAEEHFASWCQYRRSFEAYRRLKRTRLRSWKTHVIWIHGPTGTGKTYRALAEGARLYLETPWIAFDNTGTWFDGYRGEKVVVFDDFRGECLLAFMLRLLDRYPMSVPVKGDSVNWQPRIIYITSNLSPRQCYQSTPIDLLAPLFRRIEILEFQPQRDIIEDQTDQIRFYE